MQVTYGRGKVGLSYAAGSKYLPPAQSNPGITATPDDTGGYLGWGKPLFIDRATYPLPGETPDSKDNAPRPYGYWTQYGYKFPKFVTGTESDDNILLTLYVDGIHTLIECNGMTLTTQLFPDLASEDSFIPWGLAGSETVPLTPDSGSIHELLPDLSIGSCSLSIFNQGQVDLVYPGGTRSASYWYGDTYATINSVEWNCFSPTDDSGYLTQINTAVTFANAVSHPQIYKTGYWYTGGAHLFDLQDGVVADTEGVITAPLASSWSNSYLFPSQNPGKGFVHFPTGAESIFRNIYSGAQTLNRFYSRQSENAAWVEKTTFNEISNIIPKFLDENNSTDEATWDAYQWAKKYTTIYSIDTVGQNFISRGINQMLFAKSPSAPSSLWHRNNFTTNISNTFAIQGYSATYSGKFPEMMKKMRYWKNESLQNSGVYRYPFAFTDWWVDDRFDQGAVGVVGNPDYGTTATSAIVFCNMDGETIVIKDDPVGFVCPWLQQLNDGRWLVSFFEDGAYFGYVSDDKMGTSFSQIKTQTIGADTDLHSIQHLHLKDGGEFVIGIQPVAAYPFVAELIGWYRSGLLDDFAGPYLNFALDYDFTAFYTCERDDGLVEIGYWNYDTGAWIQYTSDDIMQNLSLWNLFVP